MLNNFFPGALSVDVSDGKQHWGRSFRIQRYKWEPSSDVNLRSILPNKVCNICNIHDIN